MNICILKEFRAMIIVCVWIISSPCQQRSLFLGLLQYQEKEAASSEDKCSYSITSYNTKRLEQTSIIIDYKKRVSKASFVIGQLYTFYAHFLSKRPFREYSERKPYTEWAFTKKVKCFFFLFTAAIKIRITRLYSLKFIRLLPVVFSSQQRRY